MRTIIDLDEHFVKKIIQENENSHDIVRKKKGEDEKNGRSLGELF